MKAISRFALAVSGLMFATFGLGLQQAAAQQAGPQVGVLTCNFAGEFTVIIYSQSRVNCTFDAPGGNEKYTGTTGIALGADLQFGKSGVIKFAVFSASSDVKMGSHSLAGSYAGAKASASLGAGLGAAVLVGGGPKSITLQPVGIEANTGIGAAAGLGYLNLEAAR